ncbi:MULTISPECIES: hypothetical protein [Acinetobacter]|uniref:Uncharacterized protein n=2 Tax=Acinetobacter tandoii TaxID=202954 RepID=R9AW06_9GAMM|nr:MULTISPECIES: hypothetical protein [Acinetobacter]AUX85463.1 hypothetical protein C3F34_04830 [Acinetobacter sp. ACNIH2]EOR04266.1 hypothetical protein I593_03343 [Acinetobacter tandoii DSM 14970 = CIP 107469]KAB1855853.1 hypothetical protein F4W09_08600 [Acinetobacter tandoii]
MKELVLKFSFYLLIVLTLCAVTLSLFTHDMMIMGVGILLAVATLLLGLEKKQHRADPFRN